MFRCDELHDFPHGGVGSDSIASIKVRMARTEEISLVTFTAAAAALTIETSPREWWADANGSKLS